MALAHTSKFLRRSLWTLLVFFCLANFIAAMHAWKFTHFSGQGKPTSESLDIPFSDKLRMLFTGVDNPRPFNSYLPYHPYTAVVVKSNVDVSCWYIPALKPAKGTVILFHGYRAMKAANITRAEPMLQDGYNCLLVDFMGSGESGGNVTTIGYKEAQEVWDCYEYIRGQGEKNIYLYGSSMGAASIMRALSVYPLEPQGVVIESPFASMYRTVAIRFHKLHVPVFPLANMMVFWGGLENGFWAFGHKPVEYAKDIKCPVLLQYGAKDDRVAPDEIRDIYQNLSCEKKLVVYPDGGHDNYPKMYKDTWQANILLFLNNHHK